MRETSLIKKTNKNKKQNKTKQNKTKQNETKQNKQKQHNELNSATEALHRHPWPPFHIFTGAKVSEKPFLAFHSSVQSLLIINQIQVNCFL